MPRTVDGFDVPALTVDAVVVRPASTDADGHEVLLVRRGKPPFEGQWALPGGFVEEGERVDDACCREAHEETAVPVATDRLLGVWSAPDRDPRHHTVTVVFLCHPTRDVDPRGGDDAAAACWWPLDDPPALAFDHADILRHARRVVDAPATAAIAG